MYERGKFPHWLRFVKYGEGGPAGYGSIKTGKLAPLVTIDKERKVRLMPSEKDGEGDPVGNVRSIPESTVGYAFDKYGELSLLRPIERNTRKDGSVS